MALFVVTHRHEQERCPAGDPAKGPMLLRRLSAEGAERYGVTIHAEAMIDGAHTLTMIVEGPDQSQVTDFMAPFAQGGRCPCNRPTTASRWLPEVSANYGSPLK